MENSKENENETPFLIGESGLWNAQTRENLKRLSSEKVNYSLTKTPSLFTHNYSLLHESILEKCHFFHTCI